MVLHTEGTAELRNAALAMCGTLQRQYLQLESLAASVSEYYKYPGTKSNETKFFRRGWGRTHIHKGVCGGRIACEPPPLMEAYQDMEKIDDVSPRVAAEIRHGDRVPSDTGSFKANVYK
jgi:hypothetical protein